MVTCNTERHVLQVVLSEIKQTPKCLWKCSDASGGLASRPDLRLIDFVGPDAVLVRAFAPRMVCTACGIVGADASPNWQEMKASGDWRTGVQRTT